ncbi:MAG: hypothetical protein V4729_06815 [Pseudomonadota bacterium]
MSKLSTLTPIAALLAVTVTGAAQAGQNPFALQPAAGVVLAQAGGMEGKCGEGKCGGKAAPASGAEKAGHEGKCGGDKAGHEGKCGGAKGDAGKAGKEGKCGEGKCGGMKPADAPQK